MANGAPRRLNSFRVENISRYIFDPFCRRGVRFWFLVKLLFAASAAKVIGLAAIFRKISGCRRIHDHSADRVPGTRSRTTGLRRVTPRGFFASSGENNFGKDTNRNLLGSQSTDIEAGGRFNPP